MTQCEKILRHMEKYGSITSLEAMQEYGIMRLASRVSDLKKAGIPIRVETASGKIALERLPATPGIAWIRKVVLKMARKKQETLVLFPEVATITRKFSDAQFGVLMRAVFSYRFDGEVYSGDDAAVDVAFQSIVGQVERYREFCQKQSNNAKGGEVQPSTANDSQTQPRENEGVPSDLPYPYPCPSPYPSPTDTDSGALSDSTPPVAALPLVDGTEYPVTEKAAAELSSLYPAVDVAQELRNMRGWLMANPKNRKTKAGIKRFVNGWLSREQNRARPEKQSRTGPSGNSVNNQDELMRYF